MVTPLFTRGKVASLNLLQTIGDKPFYARFIVGTQRNCRSKETLRPLCFLTPQMAFPTLSAHNFAGAGDMEAALSPFMSFEFWHPKIPLPPLLL